MPTGCTYEISTGEMTSLKEYVLICVRIMGPLRHMRDLPNDEPIPRKMEVNTSYYESQILKLKKEIKRIENLTDTDFINTLEKEKKDNYEKLKENSINTVKEMERYKNMIHKIENWNCDSALNSLKKFMLQQLQESLNCAIEDIEWEKQKVEKDFSTNTSKKDVLYNLTKQIEYNQYQIEQEIKHADAISQWLDKFFEAIDKL